MMDLMSPADPAADARALVRELFPAARAAFLGGGVLSARRTVTSDLDIVVLISGPPAPYRESMRWRGWPVELFVHDSASVREFFDKDAARRRPNLARMCAEGVILAGQDGPARPVREQARAVLAAGPPPLSAAELDARRYGLTDLVDDLAGSTDQGETAFVCWQLVIDSAELALVQAGSWLGSGKWLLRELRASDPELAEALLAARQDPAGLARLAEGVLARAGGRLWAGYRAAGT
jgi:hypothetical protein